MTGVYQCQVCCKKYLLPVDVVVVKYHCNSCEKKLLDDGVIKYYPLLQNYSILDENKYLAQTSTVENGHNKCGVYYIYTETEQLKFSALIDPKK